MRALGWFVAFAVGALLIACSGGEPAPDPTPLIKVCVEDGRKVDC